MSPIRLLVTVVVIVVAFSGNNNCNAYRFSQRTVSSYNIAKIYSNAPVINSILTKQAYFSDKETTQLYASDSIEPSPRSLFGNIRASFKGVFVAIILTLFSSTAVWARKDQNFGSLKEKQAVKGAAKKGPNAKTAPQKAQPGKANVNAKNAKGAPSKTAPVMKKGQVPVKSAPSKAGPSKASVKSSPGKGQTQTQNKKKVQADFVVEKKKSGLDGSQLNKLGFGLVAVCVLGSILVGDSKRPKPKLPTSGIDMSFINDKLNPNIMNTVSSTKSLLNDKLKQSREKLRNLPSVDDLFGRESSSDFMDLSKPENKNLNVKDLFSGKAIFSKDKTEEPAKTPSTPKKGFFDRIFKRAGGDRPTTVVEALRPSYDPSHAFRLSILSSLVNYVPRGYIDSWSQYYKRFYDEDAALADISRNKEICELSPQAAADAFADITSSILVGLVDKAAETSDLKDDNATLASLDVIADFVGGAGALFSKSLAEVTIEPVQYNGKVKKGKLENLYYIYAKSSMDMSSMLSSAGLGEGENDNNNATEKLEKLGRLAQVFAIKEGKRSSIDQKVLKEMMMSGEGGMGDLGGIMDALKGNGKMPDFGNMPPLDEDLMKEFNNMQPEEVAEMSMAALRQVRLRLS